MCVPVVGLRALEKGCAARAFSGSTQQSLKDTDYVPQSSKVLLLLKHFFSTAMALLLIIKEKQSHCEYKASARVAHQVGEILKVASFYKE